MSVQDWGADVPVSMPLPPEPTTDSVQMFGFVFNNNGLFHDINQADYERLVTPTFAPLSPADTVWDDADLVGGD